MSARANLRLVAVDGVRVEEDPTPTCDDCGALFATDTELAWHRARARGCPARTRSENRMVIAILLAAFVAGAALAPFFLRGLTT